MEESRQPSVGFTGVNDNQFGTTHPISSGLTSTTITTTVGAGAGVTVLPPSCGANGSSDVGVKDTVKFLSDPVVRSIGATSAGVGTSLAARTSDVPIKNEVDSTSYRECLRNHAATVGGHVVDGCGEFMPGEGVDFLKCSVCGCHRSFHRKEVDGNIAGTIPPRPYYYKHRVPNGGDGAHWRISEGPSSLPLLALPPTQQGTRPPYNPIPVTAFPGTTAMDSSSEELDAHPPAGNWNREALKQHSQGFMPMPPPACLFSRKRHRTKFTSEQKEKMLEFAESLGWRIHQEEEIALQRFCEEIGLSRKVFKVWMHNNKHVSSSSTSSRRSPLPPPASVEKQHQPEEDPNKNDHHHHQQQYHRKEDEDDEEKGRRTT